MSGSGMRPSIAATESSQARAGAEAEDESAQAGGEGRPPTVVYLAGSGRSGSTLVERALGEMPGFVNVGELIDLFRWTASRDELCGCGKPFADCTFWTGVGERAFGGWDGAVLADVQRLQARVARQRHMPKLLAMPAAGHAFGAGVARYGDYYARLYAAIAAQAGAATIVDASKWPVQALALARAGLDVRVLHLIRDVRGVAHSLGKHVARPQATSETDLMSHSAAAGAAARWVACQSEAELLSRCGLRVVRVRYEDFVRQPRASLEAALTGLGVPYGAPQLAHIDRNQVVLNPSHGLSGNPSRFRHGPITLRADEAWRDRMPARDRAIASAIGLPFLVRYRTATPPARAPESEVLVPDRDDWPLVSVIMPTRGRPELVRKSIAAVVAQDYRGDIECLVVHDQEPPDADLAMLGTPQRRIQVTTNTHAPGLAGARNTGLDLARGDLIATCDDDDVWHPEKLQAQVARLLADPGLLVVGSGIRLQLPSRVIEWPGRAEEISCVIA